MTCGGAALVLALLGPRLPDLRAGASGGCAGAGQRGRSAGLAAVVAIRQVLAGGGRLRATRPTRSTRSSTACRCSMYPHLPGRSTAGTGHRPAYFGGFDANHGSLVHALLHHPGFALLRVVTKPVDLLAGAAPGTMR